MLTPIRRLHRLVIVLIIAIGLIGICLTVRFPMSARLVFAVGNPTPLSPLYYIKITREDLQSLFIFGSIDRAGWELTLAQKRIEEATLLKSKQQKWLVIRQRNLAAGHLVRAQTLIDSLHGQTDTNYLDSSLLKTQKMLQGI